jgi:hypothetical protein
MYKHTYTLYSRHTDGQKNTERLTDRKTGRQTDNKAGSQADRKKGRNRQTNCL